MRLAWRDEGRQQRAARREHADGGLHVATLAHVEEQIAHQGRRRVRRPRSGVADSLELGIELAEQALDGNAGTPAGILEQPCKRGAGTPQGFLGGAPGKHVQTCAHLADARGGEVNVPVQVYIHLQVIGIAGEPVFIRDPEAPRRLSHSARRAARR